jgi:2-polyprenyl-6-methoxyphenol hydroxylase-like FAD-dependent oxidoreductase
MDKLYDVIVVGAGPVGLFLACELGLAGLSVLVLERDQEPESPWKDAPLGRRGMNTSSAESIHRRGLLGKFFDLSKRPSMITKTPGYQFGGHFAGIMFNANKLQLERWKYRLPGPALTPGATTIQGVEKIFNERAESLGVTILRGHGVKKVDTQHDDSVTVEAGETQSFRGRWLVGCDGGRSTIRKAAGFDTVGTDAQFTGYVVQGDFDNFDKLKPGFHPTNSGMYITGVQSSIFLFDFDGAAFDRTQEISEDHIQEVIDRVTGIADLKIKKILLASSFTDRCQQATSYRKGRILLAGDAAHIHSPLGAQGMNLGLGDAMNLGWKLAATVRQESSNDNVPADLALLDTYEHERHPIGAWALDWTRAQVSILQPGPFGAAIRKVVSDLIDTTDGTNMFMDRFWGLTQRYDLGDAHPLVGCSAPDFELDDDSRLGNKLEQGRGLLLDFQGDAALQELVIGGKYDARVDYLSVGAKDRRDISALLIRPDGFVVWATDDNEKHDLDAAKAALEKWLGF